MNKASKIRSLKLELQIARDLQEITDNHTEILNQDISLAEQIIRELRMQNQIYEQTLSNLSRDLESLFKANQRALKQGSRDPPGNRAWAARGHRQRGDDPRAVPNVRPRPLLLLFLPGPLARPGGAHGDKHMSDRPPMTRHQKADFSAALVMVFTGTSLAITAWGSDWLSVSAGAACALLGSLRAFFRYA